MRTDELIAKLESKQLQADQLDEQESVAVFDRMTRAYRKGELRDEALYLAVIQRVHSFYGIGEANAGVALIHPEAELDHLLEQYHARQKRSVRIGRAVAVACMAIVIGSAVWILSLAKKPSVQPSVPAGGEQQAVLEISQGTEKPGQTIMPAQSASDDEMSVDSDRESLVDEWSQEESGDASDGGDNLHVWGTVNVSADASADASVGEESLTLVQVQSAFLQNNKVSPKLPWAYDAALQLDGGISKMKDGVRICFNGLELFIREGRGASSNDMMSPTDNAASAVLSCEDTLLSCWAAEGYCYELVALDPSNSEFFWEFLNALQ